MTFSIRCYILPLITLIYCFVSSEKAHATENKSLAFLHAEMRLESLNFEDRFYVQSDLRFLDLLSRYQDTLLWYLKESETDESFLEGMREIYYRSESVRHHTFNGLKDINFHDFSLSDMKPDSVDITYHDSSCVGFYNTFKREAGLSEQERRSFFEEEESRYLQNATVTPFVLDHTNIESLQPETLYNFVLLPDDTVRVGRERPGKKQYLTAGDDDTRELFTHPNHTILAGSAQQIVMSAGAFTFFQQGSKKLFFVSNKSGHFRPSLLSLETFRQWLADHGVDVSTIILLPDVDIASFLLDNYDDTDINLSLNKANMVRLLSRARRQWLHIDLQIDRSLITSLANGDFSKITPEVVDTIKGYRDELNYLRCAYRLFLADHTVSPSFHELVKRFGRLKDALKYRAYDVAQIEATKLLRALDSLQEPSDVADNIADEASFRQYMEERKSLIMDLLSRESLHIDAYHDLKKTCRELSVLFSLLSRDEGMEPGHPYLLYRAAAAAFSDINTEMELVHSKYVEALLQGSVDDNVNVTVPRALSSKIGRHVNRIYLEPLSLDLALDRKQAGKMLYYAQDNWFYHHYCMCSDVRIIAPFYQLAEAKPVDCCPTLEEGLLLARKIAASYIYACRVLDPTQEGPQPAFWYISQINRILRQLPHRTTATVEMTVENIDPFTHPNLVNYLTEDVRVATQKTIDQALDRNLSSLRLLEEQKDLSYDDLQNAIESSEQLAVIFDLYLRYQNCETLKYPRVVYDSMARTLHSLVVELNHDQAAMSNSEGATVTLSTKQLQLVNKVLHKIRLDSKPDTEQNEGELSPDSNVITIEIYGLDPSDWGKKE